MPRGKNMAVKNLNLPNFPTFTFGLSESETFPSVPLEIVQTTF